MLARRSGIGAAALLLGWACGGPSGSAPDTCEEGREACPCFRNQSCDSGLECRSGVCVVENEATGGQGPASGGGSPGGAEGGEDPGAGGSPTSGGAATTGGTSPEGGSPGAEGGSPGAEGGAPGTEGGSQPELGGTGGSDPGTGGTMASGGALPTGGASGGSATGGEFPVEGSGYSGTGCHISGTMASGDYAHIGHNMYRGAALFDASGYDGISFYARAPSSISVMVGIGQENNEPSYGLCETDVTCYQYPGVTLSVSTEWTRYVVPFSDMQSSPPDLVPVTPARIKHFQFSMQPGAYDFWLDELYFVRAQ